MATKKQLAALKKARAARRKNLALAKSKRPVAKKRKSPAKRKTRAVKKRAAPKRKARAKTARKKRAVKTYWRVVALKSNSKKIFAYFDGNDFEKTAAKAALYTTQADAKKKADALQRRAKRGFSIGYQSVKK